MPSANTKPNLLPTTNRGLMTAIKTAPSFADVDANASDFRRPLETAMLILFGTGTRFGTYSHHSHPEMEVGPNQVIFTQPASNEPSKLLQTPMDEKQAATFGKPSTWAFRPGENGVAEVIVMRYSAHALHEDSSIDVESQAFLDELQAIADEFVAAGIHEHVEVNVEAGYLFVAPEGFLTREDTIGIGVQTLTFVPITEEILSGNERSAACWMPNTKGEPMVTGICTTAVFSRSHWEKDDAA